MGAWLAINRAKFRNKNTPDAAAAPSNTNQDTTLDGTKHINVAGIKTANEYPYKQNNDTKLTLALTLLKPK